MTELELQIEAAAIRIEAFPPEVSLVPDMDVIALGDPTFWERIAAQQAYDELLSKLPVDNRFRWSSKTPPLVVIAMCENFRNFRKFESK